MELELTVTGSKTPTTANFMNHTTIHIGAGEGLDIERQLSDKPKRLILIEPNPDLATRLREKTRAWRNVEVHEIAVIASVKEEQLATLHEYNWNSASSLQEAVELEQLFPGLQLVRNHQVKALSAAALVERLSLDSEGKHVLIIEAPASEKGIIEALCESGQIGIFSELTLTCPGFGLYSGSADITDLLKRLAAYGFETVEQDESDPDWAVFILKRSRWRYELQQAEKQQKSLEIMLSKLQEEKRTLDQVLVERDHDLEEKVKLISEHQARLQQTTQALDAQAKLATELQAQVGKLTESRESETNLRIELEAKLEQAAKARDEQARLATEGQAQVEKLTVANETELRLRTELQGKLDQATKSREEQAKLATERQRRVSELESQLADLEQRQALILEEMHRADGQIDLITDVLLREPGL